MHPPPTPMPTTTLLFVWFFSEVEANLFLIAIAGWACGAAECEGASGVGGETSTEGGTERRGKQRRQQRTEQLEVGRRRKLLR